MFFNLSAQNKSELNVNKWFYVERLKTNQSLFKFGQQKINVHFFEKPFSPHALNVSPVSQDICFITKMDIQFWIKRCEDFNIRVESGPVKRSGAIFEMKSIYLRDPDLNLIEIVCCENMFL